MFGLVEILLVILVFMIGPFVLGFVLGMIGERGVGLLLFLAVYVLLVLFWQGGSGMPSGPPTYAKAGWVSCFFMRCPLWLDTRLRIFSGGRRKFQQ